MFAVGFPKNTGSLFLTAAIKGATTDPASIFI